MQCAFAFVTYSLKSSLLQLEVSLPTISNFCVLKDCALISKYSGGIGLHIHNVRAQGSHIRGTNGSSNGIVPMLRVFNMNILSDNEILYKDCEYSVLKYNKHFVDGTEYDIEKIANIMNDLNINN